MALLAKEEIENTGKETSFRGFESDGYHNHCEVIEIFIEDELIASWGDRCGKCVLNYSHAVT